MPSQPFNEEKWREQIRRHELARSAVALGKLAWKIRLTEDYATETPATLAKLISKIADILAEKIPSEVPADELEQINTFLGVITSHLRYVERAKVAQTPWSIVQPAEKLLKLAAGPKCNFIIRPTWSYNYSITGEFWGSYRQYLSKCVWFPLDKLRKQVDLEDEQTIYCISFPRLERLNCLLHTNWGHEVGHILSKRWIDTEFDNVWEKAEPNIKKNIETNVHKNPPPFEPLFKDMAINQMVAQQTRATLEVAQQGFVELLCDRIGVHIFGPSALLSVMEFAARFAMDVSPLQADNYPPWRYRIRKMVEFCQPDLDEQMGIGYPNHVLKPFFDRLKGAKSLATATSDLSILTANIVTQEAYNVIEKYWHAASDFVVALLPPKLSKPYRLHECYKLITHLVERIENSIPPNEITLKPQNEPASIQDILCAAWTYKIMKSSSESSWGNNDDYNLLFRLVLKACESSYVHSGWGSKINKEA